METMNASASVLEALSSLTNVSYQHPLRVWIRLLTIDAEVAWDLHGQLGVEALRGALLANELGPVSISRYEYLQPSSLAA